MTVRTYLYHGVPSHIDSQIVCQDCGQEFEPGLLAGLHARITGHDVKSVVVTHYLGSLKTLCEGRSRRNRPRKSPSSIDGESAT